MTGIGIVLNFVLFPYLHREKVKKGIKDLKALIKPKDNNITSRGRGMKIGNLVLSDFILLDGLFDDYNFKFIKKEVEVKLPQDLLDVSQNLYLENQERKENNINPIFSDLKPYCIKSITFTREENGGEKKLCSIEIIRSSYFHSLISIKCLDDVLPDGQTIRNKYYSSIINDPYNLSPNGLNLIHGFGINVLVQTADNKIIIAQRNKLNVATSGGSYSISVGEHFNEESIDETHRRDIDIKKIAVRGIYEELGIEQEEIVDNGVKFLAIGFLPHAFQYGAVGFARVSIDSTEVWERIQMSKDGSREISDIKFVDFTLAGIVDFFKSTDVVLTQWLAGSLLISLMEINFITASKIASKFQDDYWRTDFLNKLSN